MKYLLWITIAAFLVSCTDDPLPKFIVLQKLRVLAMTASAPEINFDGITFTPSSIQVTPWISDLYGEGRALSYKIYGCMDPGIGLGNTPTCAGNPTFISIVQNAQVASTATFLAPNYTGALNPETVDLNSFSASARSQIQTQFALMTPAQRFNGYSFLVFFEVWPNAAPSEKITTFKRILISDASKAVKNSNPSGLEIRLGSTEITALPTTEVELNAFVPATSSETYDRIDSSGQRINEAEKLSVTWYLTGPADIECSKKKDCTTDGLFHLAVSDVSEPNWFFPPKTSIPMNRGRVLIAVAQDGRGGNMVKRYCDGSGSLCP